MQNKLAHAGIAGMLMSAALVVAAPSAQAAPRDGICQAGEFCLYFNSDQQGSVSDFARPISNYGSTQPGCYEFKGAGAGQGRCVKNSAASAWNRTPGPVTVYYNSGYLGASQAIAPGAKVNFNATLKNQNASHKFETPNPDSDPPDPDTPNPDTPGVPVNMSCALYTPGCGRITAGFDGYRTTPGRHEGIDFVRKIGSPVHALLDGQVIKVVGGAQGRQSARSLSTIAIYNATYKKTIIYLHAAPLTKLSVGQSISRGQRIATESWRGVSQRSSAHTHIEMRPGRKTNAAKSVGDRKLDNPNPATFWNSLGYSVR